MKLKPLPCPFCGGVAEIFGDTGWRKIRCQACNAKCGQIEFTTKPNWEEDLVEAWNKRFINEEIIAAATKQRLTS